MTCGIHGVVVALAAVLGAAPGCCGCKTFKYEIDGTSLEEGTYAVPLEIYFAGADDVERLQVVSSDDWLIKGDPKPKPNLQMRRFAKAIAGRKSKPISVTDLPEEVAKIFVWGMLPVESANTKPPEPLDTATFTNSNCSFVVKVSRDGIEVLPEVLTEEIDRQKEP